MKREAIRVGEIYANQSTPPLLRVVTGEGPQFRQYGYQEDEDCVGYHAFRWDGAKGKFRQCGTNLKCTRASFASWAKRLATAEERAHVATEVG